jgi:predicted Rossmann-fold nucleotide-binding protein
MERLQKLILLADAYVVLRGGTGTMLELAAVWEFLNKNMMPPKPVVALDSFWGNLVRTLRDQLLAESSPAAEAVILAHSPQQFVDVLRTRLLTTTTNGAHNARH